MRRLPATMGLMAALATVAMAQDQRPARAQEPGDQAPAVTFKVEINYVEVDAIVTDARGHLVRDLTKDDFEVLEDGRPQAVSVFSLVDIPVERAERPLFLPAAIEPDVQSNAREFDGRIFVLVLDDLHTNARRSILVRRAARQFVERYVGANDLAAVLHTSGRSDASQDFTSRRSLLLGAIDQFMGRKIRSETLGLLDQYYYNRGTPLANDALRDPDAMERGFQAESLLRTLTSLADWMGGIRGRRKSVVLFSEGIDYDITNPFDNAYATSIIDNTQRAVGAATRNNVSLYAVDPRGLTSLADEAIEIQSVPIDNTISATRLLNEVRLSQDSLRVLAEETGGFAAVNSNDFDSAFSRILEENSAYYVLGYYSSNAQRDGKFRRLDVRVKRPGVEVKAREGYVAAKGRPDRQAAEAAEGTSAALRAALESPVALSGLTIGAVAAPFKGDDRDASVLVAIELPADEFAFIERNGRFVDTLEISLMAVDHAGKVRGGARNSVKLDLRPQTHATVVAHGVRLASRVSVPPGRYQFRIAAREENAGRIGTVVYDLVVPDFSESAFAMSGLVLTSAGASRTPTPRPDEQIQRVLPGQPTTSRAFLPADQLAVFAEVYDNRPDTPHAVDILTRVLTDDGRVVFTAEDERDSRELGGSRGGYGHVAEVPLKGLAPGLYVLRVDARSRLGDQASRGIQFRIVAGNEDR